MRVDETERLRMAEERLQAEVEQLLESLAQAKCEIARLKAQPTAAQERAAIVAWLRSGTRLSPDRYALIYATSIEDGVHWPTEVEP